MSASRFVPERAAVGGVVLAVVAARGSQRGVARGDLVPPGVACGIIADFCARSLIYLYFGFQSLSLVAVGPRVVLP